MSDKLQNLPNESEPSAWRQRNLMDWLRLVFGVGVLAMVLTTVWLNLPQGIDSEHRPRSPCENNLNQIGLALHNYHDAYGSLPPPYVADAKGRPMHSWRVLILPFLKNKAAKSLYAAYRFDEPWNGPRNARLAEQGASFFHCPQDVPEEGVPAPPMTSYVAVVAKDTCWSLDQSVTFCDVTDGLSNTFLVVERGNSGIPWMEPRDIEPLQLTPQGGGKPGPTLTSSHPDGGHALMGDGATRFIWNTVPPETIQALLTRSGGEPVGDF